MRRHLKLIQPTQRPAEVPDVGYGLNVQAGRRRSQVGHPAVRSPKFKDRLEHTSPCRASWAYGCIRVGLAARPITRGTRPHARTGAVPVILKLPGLSMYIKGSHVTGVGARLPSVRYHSLTS
jgi:hypothetical protein